MRTEAKPLPPRVKITGPTNDGRVYAWPDSQLYEGVVFVPESSLKAAVAEARAQIEQLQKRNTDLCAQLATLNTPEIHDFIVAVEREAKHQRLRWGSDHDAGKADADWFWLIGYLAGKALHKPEKQLHHIITTAAACLNWHAAKLGTHTGMRPGIEPPAEEAQASRAGKEQS